LEDGYSVYPYLTDNNDVPAYNTLSKSIHGNNIQLKSGTQLISEELETIGFSLHGHTSEIHEQICPKGDFKQTLTTIKAAKQVQVKIAWLYCVVYSDNFYKLEEMTEFFYSLGLTKVTFIRLSRGGLANSLPDSMFITLDQFPHFYKTFARLKVKYAGKMKLIAEPHSWGPYASKLRVITLAILGKTPFRRPIPFCEGGDIKVAIDSASGNYYPCHITVNTDLKIGTYSIDEGFTETNPFSMKSMQHKLGEPCKSCNLLWCCGGYCRMRSIYSDESFKTEQVDIYSGNHFCPLQAGHFKPLSITELRRILYLLIYLVFEKWYISLWKMTHKGKTFMKPKFLWH
jgi:radical SAM protein with 4Fe4S-binding SPASM domain